MALNSRIQPSHAKYAEIKRMLRSVGLLDEGDPTNQLLIIAGMIQRAQKDPAAAAFLRDTIGEKPKDEVDVAVNAPPVVIGIHDPAYIDAERARQDRMLADMANGEVVDVRAEDAPTESASKQVAAPPSPSAPPQAAENPPVDAPMPQGDRQPPDSQRAGVAQPGACAKPPQKRPMTRAEAVAAMEAERRAKGGGEKTQHPSAKPMFLPSGIGRRR